MYETNVCRIKETVAEKLRGLCAGLSPEKRMLTVIVLAVLFALGNFYLIFRAIYDIGREDVQRDIIEIAPLDTIILIRIHAVNVCDQCNLLEKT